jgi:hypothetical protein
MNRNFFFVILLLFPAFLISCGGNKFDVDTSKINVKLDIKRLDKDLMVNYPDTPDVYQLINKYGNFLELYSKFVIEAGDPSSKDFALSLMSFNRYCDENQIPAKVEHVFGDFKTVESELITAFKYYKYYFPKKKIPQLYTYLSNFSISVVVDEGLLGIGLDKYLGTNFEMYQKLGLDQYKINKMHKAMIPVDCMRAIAESEFPYNDSLNNMINQIVYQGKIQYFLDAMLPSYSDTLKFGYTKNQFEWADHNEHKMWAYMVENKMLFSTDELTIRKMVGEGPFTTLFANNSAPRAGVFLGWKIVQRYMEKNPSISLPSLMENRDYQGILNAAAYKP